MGLTEIIFLLVCLLTVVGGTALALSVQLIRAAFWLFLLLLSLAGLYVFAGAEVIAVSQIVVYVGGILILIVFGVMLTQKQFAEAPRSRMTQVLPALLLVAALAAGLVKMILQIDPADMSWMQAEAELAGSNVQLIGRETITSYLLPFEAVSILLLLALIGAAYLARPDQKGPDV